MKSRPEQATLFPKPPLSESLKPDVIIYCEGCGKEIVVQHFVSGGVQSQYSDNGRCYDCCFPKKK